jgi:phage terminase large subunit GpA-like protein
VDVQIDRIEILVCGWGAGEECWAVDQQSFKGSPEHPETWKQLDDYLSKDFTRNDGLIMPVGVVCVDSGAFSQSVYDYCAASPHARRIYAVKGLAGNGKPICSKGSMIRTSRGRNLQLYIVGVDEAKLRIMHGLQTPNPGPHYIHLPLAWWCDEEFAAQLTSEQMFKKSRHGQPYYHWEKKNKKDRNEALDCIVYSLAALYIMHRGHHLRIFSQNEQPIQKVSRGTRSRGLNG